MITILVISVIIIGIVVFLSVITTSKAYTYKHTVDPIDKNPYTDQNEKEYQEEVEMHKKTD